MAKKRMSKKELKEPDEILTFLGRMAEYISKKRIMIIIISVSIFTLGASVYGYRTYVRRSEMRENAKLWTTVARIPENKVQLSDEDVRALSLVKSELEAIERKASSESVSLYARYYIANIDTRLGYYSDSLEMYRKALRGGDISPELKYFCNLGLGYSFEATSDYESALKSFEEAKNNALDSYNRATAMYGMARSYELLGKTDMAKQTYMEIIDKAPDYPDLQFIKIRMSSLS